MSSSACRSDSGSLPEARASMRPNRASADGGCSMYQIATPMPSRLAARMIVWGEIRAAGAGAASGWSSSSLPTRVKRPAGLTVSNGARVRAAGAAGSLGGAGLPNATASVVGIPSARGGPLSGSAGDAAAAPPSDAGGKLAVANVGSNISDDETPDAAAEARIRPRSVRRGAPPDTAGEMALSIASSRRSSTAALGIRRSESFSRS